MKSVSRFAVLSVLAANLCVAPIAFAKDEAVQIPVPPPENTPADSAGTVSGNLDKAKADYSAGHYEEALNDLARAQGEIRLKHASEYRSLLPAAPDGWKAGDNATNNTLNVPAWGGLTVVARRYSANGHNVDIAFMIDASPAMVAAMMTPPATTSSDTSAISFADIKENRALYKEGADAKTGVPRHSLTLVAGRVIVFVSSTTLGKDILSKFAGLVDYEALRKNK